MKSKTRASILLSMALVAYMALNLSYGSFQSPPPGSSVSGCSCHGVPNGATSVVIGGLPAGGYTPGGPALPVTFTVSNPGQNFAGFALSATAGSWSNPGGGATINTGNPLEIYHSIKQPLPGSHTFTADWTPPAAPSGIINFTGAGNAANGSGSGGDTWNTTSSAVALPVDFLSLDLVRQEDRVQIKWETENEENILRYEIQRSQDAISFETIGSVQANNVETSSKYSYDDHKIVLGNEYFYRIKELDINNKFTYSQTKSLRLHSANSNIKFYPTSIDNNIIKVDGIKDFTELEFVLYDMSGKKLQVNEVSGNTINLHNHPAGIYVVSLNRSNQILVTQKVFIR